MRLSRPFRSARRSSAVASAAVVLALVLGGPFAALADWAQFQGDRAHGGLSDGPSAPMAVAWREGVEIERAATAAGLSSPVVADDGTIVVVSPTAVLGFDAADGSEVFSADRDAGPSSQPAIGQGPDGPIVVFTEGFGENAPSATATPSPSPSPAGAEGGSDPRVNAVELRTGLPVWGSPIPLDDVVQTPVATDETAAYVGDLGGHVTAVELATGDVRWTAELGTPISGAVTLDEGRALVTTLGGREEPSEVVALDPASGEVLWRATTEEASNMVATPVVADGRILTLDAFGGVLAFDAEDGRFLWRTEVVNPIAPGNQPFFVQGVGAPAPVSADGRVFVADVTGRVYAFDAETGAELWDHALNDPTGFSPPVLTDEHVLVPTGSGVLYALDRRSGHLVSRVDAGRVFLRGIADAGDLLVGVTGFEDAALVAFEADPGRQLVDEPSPTTPDAGRMLTAYLLGAVTVGFAAVLLTTPWQRRVGPALPPEPGPQGDAG